MSQLAYETDALETIAETAPLWGFKPIEHVRAQARQIDTRAIISERDDCIVIAFAGTDPAFRWRPESLRGCHWASAGSVVSARPWPFSPPKK